MQVSQVRVAENGAECQEIGIAVQHNSAIDPGYGLQNCAWEIEHSLLMQQVVELVLRTRHRMVAMIGQRGRRSFLDTSFRAVLGSSRTTKSPPRRSSARLSAAPNNRSASSKFPIAPVQKLYFRSASVSLHRPSLKRKTCPPFAKIFISPLGVRSMQTCPPHSVARQ